MVRNIFKVPQVMHGFTMDTFLSEAYTKRLLHNTWTSPHKAFMPMYK